jgi:hypothetical protein
MELFYTCGITFVKVFIENAFFSCPYRILSKTIGLFFASRAWFSGRIARFFPFSVQMESKPVEETQKHFLSAYAFRSKVGNPALVLLRI